MKTVMKQILSFSPAAGPVGQVLEDGSGGVGGAAVLMRMRAAALVFGVEQKVTEVTKVRAGRDTGEDFGRLKTGAEVRVGLAWPPRAIVDGRGLAAVFLFNAKAQRRGVAKVVLLVWSVLHAGMFLVWRFLL